MKKKIAAITVILLIAVTLTLVHLSELFDITTQYMFMPILIFYFVGQFVERKYGK